MSGDKKGQVLHGLEELGSVTIVPLPELPEVKLGDLTELEAQAEKIRGAAAQTRDWVRSALSQLELIRGAKREVRELVTTKVAKAQQDINNLLHHEMPAYRRAAWLGLLEYEFSKDLHSRQEAESLFEKLVREGRLVENSTGPLKAYGKSYAISSDSCFEEPEVAEARGCLATLLSRVFQETGKAREEKAQELRTQGSSDLKLLIAGKAGKYVVEVPAEKTVQNGKSFWRGGGTILVESDGKEIEPLDASGSIEGAIEEARELEVFLKLYALNLTKPPVVPGLDPEKGKKLQLLWHLLKRAIRHKEEVERIARAKEAYASRVTVTDQEFFPEQKPGVCLAEFQRAWQNLDGSTGPSNFFFLVERKEEEGAKRIRIAETPDHLGNFFASCMGEYTEEGNKFEGVPYPLRAVLMAIYGQVVQASKEAKKAGQIANGK